MYCTITRLKLSIPLTILFCALEYVQGLNYETYFVGRLLTGRGHTVVALAGRTLSNKVSENER